MKKTMYSMILIGFALLMSSCSSVKVLDTWKGDNLATIKENNILVIARTDNKIARIAFEEAIANDLRKAGYKATESYLKFSNYNPDEKQDKGKIKALLEKEGFNGVVVTVVKDYSEAVVTEESGGYYAGASYGGYGGNGYYPGYYGGFYGYYHNPMAYSSYGNYVPSSTTTRVLKTYILETLIYNLDEPQDKQLVALVTSSSVDPSGVMKVAKTYSEKVLNSLKKK
ncbi:MAG: hypothetical protein L3J09_06875 [Flavobacteriaceae bacterium]|nr:hypothetical protein [Flavobacteriaceae bacterium]